MMFARYSTTTLSLRVIAILAVTCCLLPTAGAQNVIFKTVNCDTPGVADFDKIGAALNTPDWSTPLEIEVTGACHERIFIGDSVFARNSIYIHAPAGQRASITPPAAVQGTGVVIQIGGAHGIWIERMDISGGKNGVVVYDSSEVDFSDVTIENNTGIGVSAGGNSIVYFGSSRIRNNGVYGVDVSSQGANTVYFAGGPTGAESNIIEGNGQFGIKAGLTGTATLAGSNIVRNNGGNTTAPIHGGILATRNSAVSITSNTYGGTEISGNTGPGILGEVNSSITLQGANVHTNTEPGVRVKTRSVLELAGPNTFGSNGTADVSCDAWAMVTGNLTGVQTLDCKNVDTPPKK